MFIYNKSAPKIGNITLKSHESEKNGSKIYGISFNFKNKETGELQYQLFTLTHCVWDEENKEFIERETKNMNRYEQAKQQLIQHKFLKWIN